MGDTPAALEAAERQGNNWYYEYGCTAEWLTPDVELIRANSDRRIVGVKVSGVADLVWGVPGE